MAGESGSALQVKRKLWQLKPLDELAGVVDGDDALFNEFKYHFKDKLSTAQYRTVNGMFSLISYLEEGSYAARRDELYEQLAKKCDNLSLYCCHGIQKISVLIRQMSQEKQSDCEEDSIHKTYSDPKFVGRTTTIKDVIELIHNSNSDVCVYGHAGVGKTSMLAEICLLLNRKYDWHILKVDLKNQSTFIDVLKEAMRVLGFGHCISMDENVLMGYIRRGINEVCDRTLLLLDNSMDSDGVNRFLDFLKQVIMEITDNSMKQMRLLVARLDTEGVDFENIFLGPLGVEDSHELFTHCLGENQIFAKQTSDAMEFCSRQPLPIRILASTIAYLNYGHNEMDATLQQLKAAMANHSDDIAAKTCVNFAYTLLVKNHTAIQEQLFRLTVFGTTCFSKKNMCHISKSKITQLGALFRCNFIETENRWNFRNNEPFEKNDDETRYYIHSVVLSVLETSSDMAKFKKAISESHQLYIEHFSIELNKIGKKTIGDSFIVGMKLLSENWQHIRNCYHSLITLDKTHGENKESSRVSRRHIQNTMYSAEMVKLVLDPEERRKVTANLSSQANDRGHYFDSFLWKCEEEISDSVITDVADIVKHLEEDVPIKHKSNEVELAKAGFCCLKGQLFMKRCMHEEAKKMLIESKCLYESYQQRYCTSKKQKDLKLLVLMKLSRVEGFLGNICNKQKYFSDSRIYYEKACKHLEKTVQNRQTLEFCTYLTNIGSTYYEQAIQSSDKFDIDKAIPYYDESIKLRETLCDNISPAQMKTFYLRATVFMCQEEYDAALKDVDSCLEVYEHLAPTENNNLTLTLTYASAGRAFYKLFRIKTSNGYAIEGRELLQKSVEWYEKVTECIQKRWLQIGHVEYVLIKQEYFRSLGELNIDGSLEKAMFLYQEIEHNVSRMHPNHPPNRPISETSSLMRMGMQSQDGDGETDIKSLSTSPLEDSSDLLHKTDKNYEARPILVKQPSSLDGIGSWLTRMGMQSLDGDGETDIKSLSTSPLEDSSDLLHKTDKNYEARPILVKQPSSLDGIGSWLTRMGMQSLDGDGETDIKSLSTSPLEDSSDLLHKTDKNYEARPILVKQPSSLDGIGSWLTRMGMQSLDGDGETDIKSPSTSPLEDSSDLLHKTDKNYEAHPILVKQPSSLDGIGSWLTRMGMQSLDGDGETDIKSLSTSPLEDSSDLLHKTDKNYEARPILVKQPSSLDDIGAGLMGMGMQSLDGDGETDIKSPSTSPLEDSSDLLHKTDKNYEARPILVKQPSSLDGIGSWLTRMGMQSLDGDGETKEISPKNSRVESSSDLFDAKGTDLKDEFDMALKRNNAGNQSSPNEANSSVSQTATESEIKVFHKRKVSLKTMHNAMKMADEGGQFVDVPDKYSKLKKLHTMKHVNDDFQKSTQKCEDEGTEPPDIVFKTPVSGAPVKRSNSSLDGTTEQTKSSMSTLQTQLIHVSKSFGESPNKINSDDTGRPVDRQGENTDLCRSAKRSDGSQGSVSSLGKRKSSDTESTDMSSTSSADILRTTFSEGSESYGEVFDHGDKVHAEMPVSSVKRSKKSTEESV